MAEKKVKEDEIQFLIGQTISDLWRTDLDTVLAQWEEFERSQAELESTKPGKSGPNKKIPLKKKPKKKDDSDISMDGEDDDFSPVKKKTIKAKSASSVVKKESPKAAKVASASALDKAKAEKPKPKPTFAKTKKAPVKVMDAFMKAQTASPLTVLSDSLSSMDVDSKIKSSEPMSISEDDEIVVTKKRSPPRASKKKAIVISSESEQDSKDELSFEDESEEESDFQDDE